jgi:putative CocE/NonD family hydrolase
MKRIFDLRTPMRDGVELSSDLWLPAGENPSPLILLRTPYLKVSPPVQPNPLDYPGLARFFTEQGYALAVQDVRGRGDSGGEYGYYFQEGDDGYDTIEWMAAQPWCNGRIGMMGLSYLGAVQWLAASRKPAHLHCIAAAASPGDYFNELPYVGGAFLQHRLLWCNAVSGSILQTNVRDDEWAEILKHRPLLTADEAMGRKMPLYRQWLEHSTLDEYWKPLVLTEKEYRHIDIPALHITGWFDAYLSGTLYHWQGMARHSPAARDQYLIVGPWDHQQTLLGGAKKMGELEFTEDSIVDIPQLHLAFFDRYLKGKVERFEPPKVRLYVTGSNTWREFEIDPIPGIRPRRLYLSSQGKANSLNGDGQLTEACPAQEPQDRYTYDPRNPMPLDPFAPGGMFGVDRSVLECRDDVLVYTGEALEEPLEVMGRVQVELHAASDARDTDFTASLIDVYPDGRAVVLGARVAGIIRARYRRGFEATELLTPGKVERYLIDLGHLAHSFGRGHRVRVEISSSAAPVYDPNPNTGNPIATDTEWRTARQTIYHDVPHPSALLLPVVMH